MIQRVLKEQPESKYGKYFLAFEAPGDEDDQPQPMKVVKAKPQNKARFDFTNNLIQDDDVDTPAGGDAPADDMTDEDLEDLTLPGMDDDPPDDNADDVGDDGDLADLTLPGMDDTGDPGNDTTQTPANPADSGGAEAAPASPIRVGARNNSRFDFGTGMDDEPDDTENDFGDTTTPDATGGTTTPAPVDAGGEGGADPPDIDETDFGADDPGGGTNPAGTITPDVGGDPNAGADPNADPNATGTDPAAGGGAEPPQLDDTDFGADDGMGGMGTYPNAAGDPNAMPPAGGDPNDPNAQQQGPGLEYDSVRKYTLFKEFVRLRTAVSKYIERLEASISDDPESNQVIKIATTKFREIYDLLTDYMMMKYELCTYVQNLLFYQRIIATIQLIFKLLKNSKDLQAKEEKNETNRTHTTRRPANKATGRDDKAKKNTSSRTSKSTKTEPKKPQRSKK